MLNQDYILRKMSVQDLEQVMQIERDSFTLPWSKESYASELKNKFANYLVLDIGGEVAAYGGVWVVFTDAHITNIAVHEKYQHLGFGRALITGLEYIARQKRADYIYLEVRPSNIRAVNVYESMGYGKSGSRKAYYSDNGEDAYIMSKLLL